MIREPGGPCRHACQSEAIAIETAITKMAIGWSAWSGVESNVLMGTQVFLCVKWKVSEPLYQSEDAENDKTLKHFKCSLQKSHKGYV